MLTWHLKKIRISYQHCLPPGPVVPHHECLGEVAVCRELGGHAHNVVGGVGDAVVRAVLRGEVQHLTRILSQVEIDISRTTTTTK